MGEGELTFMEARHLRSIHDGMEERLGKRGYKPGERAPRDVVEEAFRDMGLDESYLAPALNEYGDFELTAAERDAVRRAFAEGGGKMTQRKVRRLAEEILGAPEGWLDTRMPFFWGCRAIQRQLVGLMRAPALCTPAPLPLLLTRPALQVIRRCGASRASCLARAR